MLSTTQNRRTTATRAASRLATALLLALLLAGCATTPAPAPVAATPDCRPRVVHVVDGDTWDVAVGPLVVRVRLAEVDTPERGQPGFQEATDFTAAWLEAAAGQEHYNYQGRDTWNRPLVVVTHAGHSLANDLLTARRARPWLPTPPPPTQ